MPPRDNDAEPKTLYGRITKLSFTAAAIFAAVVLYGDSVRPIVTNHIRFVESSQASLEAIAEMARRQGDLMSQIQKDQRQIQDDQRSLTHVVDRLMLRMEAVERNK